MSMSLTADTTKDVHNPASVFRTQRHVVIQKHGFVGLDHGDECILPSCHYRDDSCAAGPGLTLT